MKATAEKVMSEALELPPTLRAFVAEKLIESLEAPRSPRLSGKWKREIRRRCAQMDRGAVRLLDANTVFAKARTAIV